MLRKVKYFAWYAILKISEFSTISSAYQSVVKHSSAIAMTQVFTHQK